MSFREGIFPIKTGNFEKKKNLSVWPIDSSADKRPNPWPSSPGKEISGLRSD